MIADTSVWIDFFAGRATWQVELLAHQVEHEQPVGLTDVIYAELLQGFKNETDMLGAERQLLNFDVLRLEGLDDFRNAATLYRAARREGLTIRRTTDCLIAAVCIREDRPLLHNDVDFTHLALVSPLSVVKQP
ncbi:MAG TPA: PIN domain nuclease [Mycobacteriales bacterium]